MTKPRTFRQADVKRALRAAQSLGLTVTGYKIAPSGEIEVLTGAAPPAQRDPVEEWRAKAYG